MTSTLQFVVVGALVVAWGWMLGRPLLFNLLRRSRRDSVGNFRYQQAVLSPPGETSLPTRTSFRPRPIAGWRAQPLERRRLQFMMGFALATFASLLLAIALRGPFVRLLGLMSVSFVAYLCVAAYIGSVELRRLENQADERRQGARSAGSGERAASVDRVRRMGPIIDWEAPPSAGLVTDSVAEPVGWDVEFDSGPDRHRILAADPGVDTGEFDEIGDLEPIDDIQLGDIQIDETEAVGAFHDGDHPGAFEDAPAVDAQFWGENRKRGRELFGGGSSGGFFEDGFFEPIPELAPPSAPQSTPQAERPAMESSTDDQIAGDPVDTSDVGADPAGRPGRTEATFTTAPAERPQLPKRDRPRPIYIESELDEKRRDRRAAGD